MKIVKWIYIYHLSCQNDIVTSLQSLWISIINNNIWNNLLISCRFNDAWLTEFHSVFVQREYW